MESSDIGLFDLQVDHEAASHLRETARWAKFMSIVGFVGCGLIILSSIGITLSSNGNAFGRASSIYTGGVIIGYGIAALLWFFPCLYLYNFARKMQAALRNNDQPQLNQAFKNLKACYRFIGIFTIIWIGLAIVLVAFNLFGSMR